MAKKKKNHKSGQAVRTSYKERHRETVKGRGTLFLMDKPPLLLLCRGKLGGHPGEAGVLPPPPVTDAKSCMGVAILEGSVFRED